MIHASHPQPFFPIHKDTSYPNRKMWDNNVIGAFEQHTSNKFNASKQSSRHIGKKPEVAQPLFSNETRLDLEKLFHKNILKAMKLCEEFLVKLEKYNCKMVMMRASQINAFDAIYFIDKELYFSTEFLKAYTEAFSFSEKHNKDINVNIKFMAKGKHTNFKAIIADGYIFKHEK
jgi:hypothetical protein